MSPTDSLVRLLLAAVPPAASDPTPVTATRSLADQDAGFSMTKAVEYLLVTSLDWAGRILGVVVILVAAWILARWARRSAYRLIMKANADVTVAAFAGNAARWSVLILGVVACLSIFGINIAAVTAVIGAAGLAVGLAMQGSLSNLAAGIMLLVLRPFHVGDGITVAGQSGRVDDIDLFSTKIDTVDNRRLIVPNAQVFGAVIENGSHHERRRVDVTLRTPVTVAIDPTRAALTAAAERVAAKHGGDKAEAALADFAPNGLLWSVRLWVATSEVANAKDSLVQAAKESLDAARIPIAVTP